MADQTVMINGLPHTVQTSPIDALNGFPSPTRPAPSIASRSPVSAVVGSADVTLHVVGSNFPPSARVIFNGGEEPSTWVSSAQIDTVVKPSTASGPATVPVSVSGATNATTFEFTAS